MAKKDELPDLMRRILAHRERATVRPTASNGPTLFQAKHDRLTIFFYDARHELTPNIPPTGIEIREGEETPDQFKLVFRGYVDPHNIAHADFTKWTCGEWEARL
jgi:hypothetical protein